MKQKVNDAVICNALYLLFVMYHERWSLSKEWKADENKNIDFRYSFRMKKKATDMEDLIRELWGTKSQYLLSGILIYLIKLDPYFSPKLNDYKLFFIKIYRHRQILAKIGTGNHKVIFPFRKLIEKKKVVLIRC